VNERGDGQQWTQLNLAAHHNRTFPEPGVAFSDQYMWGACPPHTRTAACMVSSSYTGVAALPDGESAVLSYDRYGVRPGEPDRVFTVHVRVRVHGKKNAPRPLGAALKTDDGSCCVPSGSFICDGPCFVNGEILNSSERNVLKLFGPGGVFLNNTIRNTKTTFAENEIFTALPNDCHVNVETAAQYKLNCSRHGPCRFGSLHSQPEHLAKWLPFWSISTKC
jgi:hypothetical protein